MTPNRRGAQPDRSSRAGVGGRHQPSQRRDGDRSQTVAAGYDHPRVLAARRRQHRPGQDTGIVGDQRHYGRLLTRTRPRTPISPAKTRRWSRAAPRCWRESLDGHPRHRRDGPDRRALQRVRQGAVRADPRRPGQRRRGAARPGGGSRTRWASRSGSRSATATRPTSSTPRATACGWPTTSVPTTSSSTSTRTT